MSGVLLPELGRNCNVSGPHYSTKKTSGPLGLSSLQFSPPGAVIDLTKAITAPYNDHMMFG
jgi:hypothetical protein